MRETGYTLPDILMLCALADYFEVTTDELLGRNPNIKYAVIAASSPELGADIQKLARSYGFVTKQIFSTCEDAVAAANTDTSITHLFASFDEPLSEEAKDTRNDGLHFIEVQVDDPRKVLHGFEIYFRSMEAYDTIALNSKK